MPDAKVLEYVERLVHIIFGLPFGQLGETPIVRPLETGVWVRSRSEAGHNLCQDAR